MITDIKVKRDIMADTFLTISGKYNVKKIVVTNEDCPVKIKGRGDL